MHWLGAALCCALVCAGAAAAAVDYGSEEAVQLFQRYLRINTTTGNDLTEAVDFWRELAEEEGLELQVLEFVEGYPVLVIKWPGLDSSLGSIMLNSHIDVVPADEAEGWTYPPFAGYLDEDGVIWGRGTQDTKSISIQYFEALRRIKANGVSLLRDVYITLMPDEEIGGAYGMQPLLESDTFKNMNVGLELDEGTSSDMPLAAVFYQDKVPWQIRVDCYGISAHSSTFPESNTTASGKCANVIAKLMSFRESEYQKYLSSGGVFNAGAYTNVNLNILEGGTANNVIPGHVSLVFDIRLATDLEETAFDAQLREWIAEAGENVTLTYILQDQQSPATDLSASNPYWTTFATIMNTVGLPILPIVPPGATDARFVRNAGYPAFGFSPMINTEILLHAVNEHVSAATFMQGIDVYEQLISGLANIAGNVTSADPSVYVIKTAVN